MKLGTLQRTLYRAARATGDLNAIVRHRYTKHIANRMIARGAFRFLRRLFFR